MKKDFLLVAAAATMLTACVNFDTLNEANTPDESAIDFSTFASNQTKAENSTATTTNALEKYHDNFKVWGSKYIGSTPTVIFDAQVVNKIIATPAVLYQAGDDEVVAGTKEVGDVKTPAVIDWTYYPIRFWDKSAAKYDFYAAAPADPSWVWDNTNKKLSLDNFSVTGVTLEPSTTIDAAAVFGPKDIMISEDITDYTSYTSDKVGLSFIHILTRLNIGVKKATPLLDDYIVKLESIKVFNMKSNGKFNENQAAADNNPGNNSRWIAPTEGQAYFETGVGYETETEVETSMKYVYQALAIPQTVDYEAGIELDGSNINESTSKPYLKIEYEIWTKDIKYTAEEAADYNTENSLSEGDPGYKTTDDVKTASYRIDGYNYTYNLADMFNGDSQTSNVNFNEGWMNTLNITINPIAIEFDAEVYEWAATTPVEVDVPEANPNN